jgi:hypothetical protein
MKAAIEIVGGWAWYCRMYKSVHPEQIDINYQKLMQQYIKSIPYQEATDE